MKRGNDSNINKEIYNEIDQENEDQDLSTRTIGFRTKLVLMSDENINEELKNVEKVSEELMQIIN